MRIITVDDDRTTRFLIRKILVHEFNAEVIEAENGIKALEILGEGPHPDLACVDMMMPRMDGIELLENIRMNFGLRRMKIIMCSAQNERIRIAQAYALDIQDYILKPVQTQKLAQAVRLALRLNAESASAKKEPANVETNLAAYMRQLSLLAQQTELRILRIERSVSIGDRISAAASLKEIVMTAGALGINMLADMADKLADKAFQCTEATLADGIKRLKEEQARINETVAGAMQRAIAPDIQPRSAMDHIGSRSFALRF